MPNAAGDEQPLPSPYAPLRRPAFRLLWSASLVSNIGTWLQSVGAAWLMTDLSPSPFLVALVQAATTLPVFLLAVPAGALADIFDRRRLLLVAQGWMLLVAAVLAGLTAAGLIGPASLLALTFALGVGFALNSPAWQAIVPELVPRGEIPAAVALNGVSMNVSRAVGPAVGGALVAAAGPEAAFALNAVSFVAVLVVVWRWDAPAAVVPAYPAERLFGAMRAGVRYVRHAPAFRAVLARTAAFVGGAGGLWALLPAIAREHPDWGPAGYGWLLASLGAGAVAGTFALPAVRRQLGEEGVVAAGTLTFAGAVAALVVVPDFAVRCVVLVPAGAGWLAALTAFSSSAQTLLPPWVRGRGLAVYQLVFFGGLAGSSVGWGVAADQIGVPAALLASAAVSAGGLLAMARYRLPAGPPPDLDPSRHWPEAPTVADPDASGPVLVQVEYQVDPASVGEFVLVAHALLESRLRDGAIRWDLFADAADPGRLVEVFLVESWAEHLRQHDRTTVGDQAAEAAVRAFHRADAPPRVVHLVTASAASHAHGPSSRTASTTREPPV